MMIKATVIIMLYVITAIICSDYQAASVSKHPDAAVARTTITIFIVITILFIIIATAIFTIYDLLGDNNDDNDDSEDDV